MNINIPYNSTFISWGEPCFGIIEQTLHMSKMMFDRVVLGPIAIMFLLGCSSEGLTVVVLWRKGKA